jgi:serine/threonine protein kinase
MQILVIIINLYSLFRENQNWKIILTHNGRREQGVADLAYIIYIFQVGQGTYSNVYKALDRDTGDIVALKKVRFNTSEPESIKFMAREITILQKLDHPNVVKLKGLATSRMQYSIYLVFDFMPTDLSRIITRPDERLTEPQVRKFSLLPSTFCSV